MNDRAEDSYKRVLSILRKYILPLTLVARTHALTHIIRANEGNGTGCFLRDRRQRAKVTRKYETREHERCRDHNTSDPASVSEFSKASPNSINVRHVPSLPRSPLRARLYMNCKQNENLRQCGRTNEGQVRQKENKRATTTTALSTLSPLKMSKRGFFEDNALHGGFRWPLAKVAPRYISSIFYI